MKQLATATLKVKDGKKTSYEQAFIIRGADDTYKAEEVNFKVLDYYIKILQWNVDATKVVNETVYFNMNNFKDAVIPDRNGGNACGRTFNSWGAASNPNNAKWYGYLFGEVTFPGHTPILVNYRLTGGQCMEWGAIEREIGNDLSSALLKLSAVGREGKEHIATCEYSILQQGLDTSGNVDAVTAIKQFVDAENEKILNEHNAKKPVAAKVANGDEIPF